MSWLLGNGLTTALLALCVALGCRLCKPRPAVAHLLWFAVLVKLVTPPLFRFEVPHPEPAPRIVELDALLAAASAAPAPSAPSETLLPWLPWLALLGSVVVALCYGRSALRMRRALATSDKPSDIERRELEVLARRYGIRPPRVAIVAGCTSPFLWTLGRTVLVLPRSLGDRRARAALLAHELAHVRRGDPWFARFEALLAVALWWHPLFWIARRAMREEAELACDAWVLWAVPDARLKYADALIASLERESTASPLSVLAARPSARAAFERRLKMILNETVPYRLTGRALAPLCALTLGLFAMPTLAQGSKKEPATEIRVNGKSIQELDEQERAALLEALERTGKPAKKRARGVELVDVTPQEEPKRRRVQAPSVQVEGRPIEVRRVVEGHPLVVTPKGDVVRVVEGHPAHEVVILEDETPKVRKGEFLELEKVKVHEVEGHPLVLHGHQAHEGHQGHTKVVEGTNDLGPAIHDIVGKAMRHALSEVRDEIRSDTDLVELGIAKDVETLIDALIGERSESKFQKALSSIVQKSIQNALSGARKDVIEERRGEPLPPIAPKKPAKARIVAGR